MADTKVNTELIVREIDTILEIANKLILLGYKKHHVKKAIIGRIRNAIEIRILNAEVD